MIKYLGSKRALVGVLGAMADAAGARTALDLFTGTTRVAQEFCRRGLEPIAVDTASYSHVFGQCYVETDADRVELAEVADALAELAALPDVRGYVTETFCEQARYFHPDNGRRIDAIRQGIEDRYGDSWLRPLRLRVPELTPGTGRAIQADALAVIATLPKVDLAYLDPPYNQHRYFTNYHVWETIVRWDAPAHYGVACKRLQAPGRPRRRHAQPVQPQARHPGGAGTGHRRRPGRGRGGVLQR